MEVSASSVGRGRGLATSSYMPAAAAPICFTHCLVRLHPRFLHMFSVTVSHVYSYFSL